MPNSNTSNFSPAQKRDLAAKALDQLFYRQGENFRNIKRVSLVFHADNQCGLRCSAWATVSTVIHADAALGEAEDRNINEILAKGVAKPTITY